MTEYGRLYLNRREGESIIITMPDSREIKIIHGGGASHGTVRIIIEAPKDIVVLREEVPKHP